LGWEIFRPWSTIFKHENVPLHSSIPHPIKLNSVFLLRNCTSKPAKPAYFLIFAFLIKALRWSDPDSGDYVGLEEIDDGIWNVYFGPLKLGRLNERHLRIEDQYGRLKRKTV